MTLYPFSFLQLHQTLAGPLTHSLGQIGWLNGWGLAQGPGLDETLSAGAGLSDWGGAYGLTGPEPSCPAPVAVAAPGVGEAGPGRGSAWLRAWGRGVAGRGQPPR